MKTCATTINTTTKYLEMYEWKHVRCAWTYKKGLQVENCRGEEWWFDWQLQWRSIRLTMRDSSPLELVQDEMLQSRSQLAQCRPSTPPGSTRDNPIPRGISVACRSLRKLLWKEWNAWQDRDRKGEYNKPWKVKEKNRRSYESRQECRSQPRVLRILFLGKWHCSVTASYTPRNGLLRGMDPAVQTIKQQRRVELQHTNDQVTGLKTTANLCKISCLVPLRSIRVKELTPGDKNLHY